MPRRKKKTLSESGILFSPYGFRFLFSVMKSFAKERMFCSVPCFSGSVDRFGRYFTPSGRI